MKATAALCGVVGLLVATGAAPGPAVAQARGRAPEPPVVVDIFKPVLACDPNTTVGQEGCQERKVLAADKQLNADIRLIFGLLGTQAKRDFINAQTAWATFRHDDCVSQSDIYLGGTEQPVVYGACLHGDDLSRRHELEGFYAGLVQGRAKAPQFP